MLRQRLVSAFIIITLSFGFVALDANVPLGASRGAWMTLLAIYLMFGSAVECCIMLRHRWPDFDVRPALIGCGGVMLAGAIPMLWPLSGSSYPATCQLGPLGWPLAAALFAQVGCFAWFMPRYAGGTGVLERAVTAGWVAVYFGIGFAFWVAMRQLGSGSWGLSLVVGMIVVTKFADAGAYFSGRNFGRTKLCPAVSPGKTIEGLVGGVIVGVVVSVLYFHSFVGWLYGLSLGWNQLLGPVVLGVALAIAGLVGDLLESVVKRETEMKDSSHFLPGLGGLWDITDSLLPAGAVGYLIVAADLLAQPA